jgi:hypothetical protein
MYINREAFIEILMEKLDIRSDKKVDELVKLLSDHRTCKTAGSANISVAEELNLGDIEDFALGFLQHNVKIFVFG